MRRRKKKKNDDTIIVIAKKRQVKKYTEAKGDLPSFPTGTMSTKKPLELIYVPINDTQKALQHKWANSKLVILTGVAGSGKTAGAVGQAFLDLMNKKITKLVLCRPTVAIEEDIGFLPGDINEKMLPWLGPFADVLGDFSNNALVDFPVEIVPVGMLRGRTIKNAVLIVDEAQNLTHNQIKCICTRVGKNGKIVLCGDSSQNDIGYKVTPLDEACKRLINVEGVSIFRFAESDQLREPFINLVVKALS